MKKRMDGGFEGNRGLPKRNAEHKKDQHQYDESSKKQRLARIFF